MPNQKRQAVKAAKARAKDMGLPKRSKFSKVLVEATYKNKNGNLEKVGGKATKRIKNVSQKSLGRAVRKYGSLDY